MKASELRIGNFVTLISDIPDPMTEHLIQVDIKHLIDIVEFPDLYNPIQLTPDWLEKFGFKHNYITAIDKNDNNIEIVFDGNGSHLEPAEICVYKFEIDEYGDGYADKTHHIKLDHIQHVHQLQNLYFALTGEELTIKGE